MLQKGFHLIIESPEDLSVNKHIGLLAGGYLLNPVDRPGSYPCAYKVLPNKTLLPIEMREAAVALYSSALREEAELKDFRAKVMSCLTVCNDQQTISDILNCM